MKTCTFAGHSVCRDIFIADLAEREIKRILEENDIIHFYCGGMGEFDKLCETTLHDMKHVFPDKQIFIDLVMPFSTKDMDYNPRYYNDNYSNVIIPDCLSQYDSKKKIPMRNRWMVDTSEFLIAYVTHKSSGAWNTLQHAIKKRRSFINLSEIPTDDHCYSFNQIFGLIIKLNRRINGIALEGFSKATKLSYDYLYNIENALRAPTLDAIVKISRSMNMAPHTLIETAEQEYKKIRKQKPLP